MVEEKNNDKEKENKCHKYMAIACFNKTWEYMEKQDRTVEEDELMVYSTMASRYHWGQIGDPINFQRGEWQISRVFTLLNRGEQALHHSKLCLKLTEEHNIKDFDLAFAYECMARAFAAAGDKMNFEKYFTLAEDAGKKINEKGDRDYFFNDLKGGNWFGII